MVVSAVGRALRRSKAATLSQLAAELGVEASMVEAALDFWQHRGNVAVCDEPADAACGTSCRRCPIADAPTLRRGAVVYEWVDPVAGA